MATKIENVLCAVCDHLEELHAPFNLQHDFVPKPRSGQVGESPGGEASGALSGSEAPLGRRPSGLGKPPSQIA